MSRIPSISEASMREAEDRIPELAAQAGRAAHQRALTQTGSVITKSADGMLVIHRADGDVKIIKALPPSTPVQRGLVLRRIMKSRVSDSGTR